nr:hypothetical protein HmN_000947900 [Hymenolepis microstoma]
MVKQPLRRLIITLTKRTPMDEPVTSDSADEHVGRHKRTGGWVSKSNSLSHKIASQWGQVQLWTERRHCGIILIDLHLYTDEHVERHKRTGGWVSKSNSLSHKIASQWEQVQLWTERRRSGIILIDPHLYNSSHPGSAFFIIYAIKPYGLMRL